MGRQTWKRWTLLLLTGLFGLLLLGESFFAASRWIGQPFPGFFVHENLTVGPYFLPSWTGLGAGLQPLDRIVGLNDQQFRNRGHLYELLRDAPAGTQFRYRMIRDGRNFAVTMPTMSLGLRDWLLSFGVYSFIGVAFLVIGVAPYFFRAASPAALPLCFMALAVFVWFEATFDFMTEAAWPKELRIFALSLTPSAAIHLALMLRHGSPLGFRHRLLVAGIYGAGLALGALNSLTFFGPLEIWIYSFRAGYVYICLGAVSFLWLTATALQRTQSDLERSRLRVMFVGALLGFLIPAVTAVLASSSRLPIPYNMALVPTLFFPLSVAYALTKYSLFELGNALRVALSRLALMVLLVAIYAAVALVLAPWAGRYAQEPLIPILFSIVVVAIFNPLLRRLEGVVDRYVYKQEYDSAQVQEEISLFLRSLAAAPVLAQGFIERMSNPLRIAAAAVVYRPKNSNDIIAVASESSERRAESLALGLEEARGFWQSGDYRAIARSEVTNHPRFAATREVLLGLLDRWRAELIMPLVYEREVRGVLSLGAKHLGGEYSAEDFRLLRTLSEQLALSLENGRLYEESMQAYQRVEASNKKLMEMDRVKKDFVANICHELRTPVTTIIGFGEVLRDLNIQADGRNILDRLINNGQELSQLMDSLMNYSRMETDGSLAQVEVVKLKEILTTLEIMTQRLIRQRPIQFGVYVEPTIETIESDGQKLQQILTQLLTNALKFTERGKIELNLRRLRDGSDELVEIAVADTGIGIKREDQEIIFEDFRQLDGSSTRQYGGTGLGLGLCKKLAAALGGEIRLSSEVGVGSVFSLRLPIKSPTLRTSRLAAAAASPLLQ